MIRIGSDTDIGMNRNNSDWLGMNFNPILSPGILYAVISAFERKIVKKRPESKKKKVLFHQDNAPCHKSIATIAKLHEFDFELLPHPPYSLGLAPSNYYLFADLTRMLQ